MFKLLGKKKYLIILCIIFILLIFRDVIYNYLTFDVNAPDLGKHDGYKIKSLLINNLASTPIMVFNFMFWISFFTPICLIVLGYDYSQIKNNYLKYNIGKNSDYFKKLFITKIKFALLASSIVLVIYLIVIGVSLFSNDHRSVIDGFEFSHNSILYSLFNSSFGFLFFRILTVFIATFLNCLFYFTLADYFGYIKGSLGFIFYIWLGSSILYRFLPFYLVPTTSIMITSYGSLTLIQVFLPYTVMIIVLAVILMTKKYEVN